MCLHTLPIVCVDARVLKHVCVTSGRLFSQFATVGFY